MKKKILLISFFTFLIDQVVKMIVDLKVISFTIIPKFLSFIYVKNEGVAFSMLKGSRIYIIIITVFLLLTLYYIMLNEYQKEEDRLLDMSFGLLFGGIIGNLVDRIMRGFVIDYISITLFKYMLPIFNIADVAITIGIILLILSNLTKDNKANV